MSVDALDYAAPGRRRWPWRKIGIVAAGLVLLLALVSGVVRQEVREFEAVTGSSKRQTAWSVWGIGLSRRTQMYPSLLEERLRRSRIAWTPEWRRSAIVEQSIWGKGSRSRYYGWSYVRPIHFREFLDGATDDEVRAYVRAMESGSLEQQEEAMRAAEAKGSARLGK